MPYASAFVCPWLTYRACGRRMRGHSRRFLFRGVQRLAPQIERRESQRGIDADVLQQQGKQRDALLVAPEKLPVGHLEPLGRQVEARVALIACPFAAFATDVPLRHDHAEDRTSVCLYAVFAMTGTTVISPFGCVTRRQIALSLISATLRSAPHSRQRLGAGMAPMGTKWKCSRRQWSQSSRRRSYVMSLMTGADFRVRPRRSV